MRSVFSSKREDEVGEGGREGRREGGKWEGGRRGREVGADSGAGCPGDPVRLWLVANGDPQNEPAQVRVVEIVRHFPPALVLTQPQQLLRYSLDLTEVGSKVRVLL